MISLRRTALFWLSGLLLAIGLASAVTSYFLVQTEADGLLDGQLRQIAHYVDDMPGGPAPRPSPNDPDYEPEDDFLIQVWDANGVLHSSDEAVAMPRHTTPGFSYESANNAAWRMFNYAAGGERTVQISQRMAVREELARDAALRSAVPVLVLIPLAWLLLGFIVDRVLRRLDNLAVSVAKRSASDRSSIPLKGVPSEVAPLIKAMNELLSRLQHLIDRQRRFISDAAHELRTPLAALQLQVENLHSVAKGKALISRLGDVEAGARRATQLANQLLRLARYDGEGGEGPIEAVEIGAVLTRCVEEITPLADREKKSFVLKLDADPCFEGRTADLKTMLFNIIDNAVRYSPKGGSIEVRLANAADGAAVEILDSGPGIPEPLLDRVFERFFRAASQNIEGSGLGLAIVRSIADRYRIAIELANRPAPESGLRVRMTFPVAR